MNTPTEQDEEARRTAQLGFRIEPEKAEKIRALAEIDEVPYADLLRDKADELCARYDRVMARASERAA